MNMYRRRGGDTGSESIILGDSYLVLGTAFLEMGERGRAEEFWKRLKERAELTQDPNLLMGVLSTEGFIAVVDGRLEDAVAVGERTNSMKEEVGLASGALPIAPLAPLTLLGRTEEALARIDEFSEALRAGGFLRPVQAAALADAGRVEEAIELSDRYMAQGSYGEAEDETISPVLLQMLNTAVIVKDREASEVLYGRLAVVSSPALMSFLGTLSNVNRILGGAAALLEDYEAARTHYVKSLELMGKIRFRPEIALTRLELAELLLDHFPDERAEALEHLDFSITELRDMKMQPALERAVSRREILRRK